MAIVQPKSIKYRKMAAHCLMVAFILAILFFGPGTVISDSAIKMLDLLIAARKQA